MLGVVADVDVRGQERLFLVEAEDDPEVEAVALAIRAAGDAEDEGIVFCFVIDSVVPRSFWDSLSWHDCLLLLSGRVKNGDVPAPNRCTEEYSTLAWRVPSFVFEKLAPGENSQNLS